MSISQMVRISPKAKRIQLQRFLLSKFVNFKEELEMRDICCLFENQLWLERKCLSDSDFCKKFGRDLESLSIILQQINFRMETSDRAINKFSERIHDNLTSLILPKRNYLAAKKSKQWSLFTDRQSAPGSSQKEHTT
jgi:ABC-type ATPase with predicted acetyltransferase domain